MADYPDNPCNCDNNCIYNCGWFEKVGFAIKPINRNDYSGTSMPKFSFLRCSCKSKENPFYIYNATARMLRILGCGMYMGGARDEVPVARKMMGKSTIDAVPDIKESDVWTEYDKRHGSGHNVHQSVHIDGYRDLSVTNVDMLPESIGDLFHNKKKRISGIPIIKAEEFNAGDPFAQMKSDEVDDFFGFDDAP